MHHNEEDICFIKLPVLLRLFFCISFLVFFNVCISSNSPNTINKAPERKPQSACPSRTYEYIHHTESAPSTSSVTRDRSFHCYKCLISFYKHVRRIHSIGIHIIPARIHNGLSSYVGCISIRCIYTGQKEPKQRQCTWRGIPTCVRLD